MAELCSTIQFSFVFTRLANNTGGRITPRGRFVPGYPTLCAQWNHFDYVYNLFYKVYTLITPVIIYYTSIDTCIYYSLYRTLLG